MPGSNDGSLATVARDQARTAPAASRYAGVPHAVPDKLGVRDYAPRVAPMVRPGAERVPSSAHSWRFDRQPLPPPREIELEVRELRRARARHLGAYAEQTCPDPPLQGSEALPFEAIGREGIAVPLAESLRIQPLAPVLLVALGAGEVHLAVPAGVQRASALEARARAAVDAHRERHSAGLRRDVSADREQLVGFALKRLRALMPDATGVDAGLEIHDSTRGSIVSRVSRGHASHRCGRVAVTGLAARTVHCPPPQRLAALDPQEAGIGDLVGLHRPNVGARE